MKFNFNDTEQIKNSGFQAPAGFFDSFPEQIQTQWEQQNSPVKRVGNIFLSRWLGAAAVIAFIISLPLLTHFFSVERNMSATAISHYIQTQTEVTDEEVAYLLNNEQWQQLENEYPAQQDLFMDETLSNVHSDELILD